MRDPNKCPICGRAKAESIKMCIECLEKYSPPAYILHAMLSGVGVENYGVRYDCISGYIMRMDTRNRAVTHSVELTDVNKNSVTIANPYQIKF